MLRLPASPGGYGLILGLDDDGARWTRATTDVRGIQSVQSIWATGLEAGYEPPDGTVAATLPGWPVECALGLLGLPEPHDPPGTAALRPPASGWNPARRRAMTDQIADELSESGHQSAEDYHQARQWHYWNLGETDLIPRQPRLIDLRQPVAGTHSARPAADKANRRGMAACRYRQAAGRIGTKRARLAQARARRPRDRRRLEHGRPHWRASHPAARRNPRPPPRHQRHPENRRTARRTYRRRRTCQAPRSWSRSRMTRAPGRSAPRDVYRPQRDLLLTAPSTSPSTLGTAAEGRPCPLARVDVLGISHGAAYRVLQAVPGSQAERLCRPAGLAWFRSATDGDRARY